MKSRFTTPDQRTRRWAPLLVIISTMLLAGSCNDGEAPTPVAPSPLPSPAPDPSASSLPIRFDTTGHWEALSNQSRRIAFDVSKNFTVIDGRINVHHDCTNGRLRMTMDGFRGDVKDHTFSATMHWRINDKGLIYSGVVTVSGRFESPGEARGGFVNSVSEKPGKDGLGTCPSVHGTWQAFKE